MRRFWLLAVLAGAARAETYTLTIKEAVDRALAQNPDVIMARMDEMKAVEAVRIARDPFTPRVGAGSGLAYSNGFPLSIEGSAPAIIEAKANQYLFNRPQTYALAQAKVNARGAGYATGERRDEIAYRVAMLYIDVDRAGRLADAAQQQVESLEKVYDAVNTRVEAGRELPVTKQEANVNLLRARQRLLNLQSDRDYGEHNLAAALGYSAGDSVRPASTIRTPPAVPETEDAALRTALNASKELKRLDTNLEAKGLEIKGDKAQRLPRVDLVAQYALLSKYSNYDQYFLRFQRNNGELGASIQIPLWTGPGLKAQVAQAEADQQHLRAEMLAARNRITLDVHQSYQEINKANVASQVAKAELDLAHTQVSVLLAQMNEGRATLRQVEEARFNENEKWIAFYDAQFNAEKARLNVLRQTGDLTAALRTVN
jgi:outer membrane protein TolC